MIGVGRGPRVPQLGGHEIDVTVVVDVAARDRERVSTGAGRVAGDAERIGDVDERAVVEEPGVVRLLEVFAGEHVAGTVAIDVARRHAEVHALIAGAADERVRRVR